MTLDELNNSTVEAAEEFFAQTCAAKRWVTKMQEQRPYANKPNVLQRAQANWQDMGREDFLQAFDAHPMIGDISSLREKYASTKAMASNEQDGARQADEVTLLALQKLNLAYKEKHGFIFIICASGLDAHTMLKEIEQRIENTTATEISNASDEQIKITILRILKGLSDE
ncbi:2-oxo-4-hydroxy-4-carboxy-5-ureidoimidazoline decarboxylase [Paraglaciecola sp. L1A13]|uniref:2-oxo-4-hydroxy-4-carboxy-5-ureidoimidazoline decarboxylase n=1 Tax=Paraglaciecola sp. L1A13 TaxID=2686359 RepID=UPI00131BEEE7|nr:2-oxo-4-hydroxy-4-carboxy-5-ureidoimidazoline decarboxylase [Paraglaciecola sp. L1A13]